MTTAVIALHAADTVGAAREQMKLARIRHIPVVDAHDRVIGIVSSRDLLRSKPARPIRELMTHPVLTVHPQTPGHRAAALLREKKFGSLPVVGDDEQLVGIVTESDFLAVAEEALGGNASTERA
ncbi:MAG: CBS domain-containing protein [Polyangia bacterium]